MEIKVEQIIENYPIENIQEISPLPNRSGVIVRDDCRSFLLRPIRFISRTKSFLYEDAFTTYLVTHGYPAQRFVRTRRGTLVCSIEGEAHYLTEYIEGALYPNSNTVLTNLQIEEAGSQLARLHLLSCCYSGPIVQKVPFNSQKCYSVLNRVLAYIGEKEDIDESDILVAMVVKRKLEYIKKRPFETQDFIVLSRMMNHGDFHAGNIVFDAHDHIVGVLDFEYCTYTSRLWDIAWALSWLCGTARLDAFSGPLDHAKVTALLSSYHARYPFTSEEKIALQDLYVSSSYHATYYLENSYLRGSNAHAAIGYDHVDKWLWAAAQQPVLGGLIQNACL